MVRKGIEQSKEVEHFLNGEKNTSGHQKTTTEAFYGWMRGAIKGLYGDCFQLAFDIAKKAERALQHELGDPSASYLQTGYLAGKEGLLAGESLYLDIKRMETAFNDRNRREYELSKNVTLLQVNPHALLELRYNGSCAVTLPEELFDIDGPGHYFRRIKSVAVSVPCVAGPYSSVNCTLTQTKSTIRTVPLFADGYPRQGAEDSRFSDHFGSTESIVTSSGQNDSGMFETNLRDERFLPFEGTGALSEWQLSLPARSKADPRQFDYDTISDVILHIRYTARDGGEPLRGAAMANLNTRIDDAQTTGSTQLFSIRHDFSTEWAKFKNEPAGDATLTITLRDEHFPFWSKGHLGAVKQASLFAKTTSNLTVGLAGGAAGDKVPFDDVGLGPVKGCTLKKTPTKPTDAFALDLSGNSVDDLWLLIA